MRSDTMPWQAARWQDATSIRIVLACSSALLEVCRVSTLHAASTDDTLVNSLTERFTTSLLIQSHDSFLTPLRGRVALCDGGTGRVCGSSSPLGPPRIMNPSMWSNALFSILWGRRRSIQKVIGLCGGSSSQQRRGRAVVALNNRSCRPISIKRQLKCCACFPAILLTLTSLKLTVVPNQ